MMADVYDPYGFGEYDVSRAQPITGRRKGTDGITTGLSVVAPEFATPAVPTETPTTPALTGSPLNTLYGVDDESYLTDDQRKIMRQIQGKFDASMNRRDRELARYGAPQLASYVEDEALARAIAGAQALNYREPQLPVLPTPSGGGGGGGSGGTPRAPYTVTRRPTEPPDQTGAQTNAQWQRIMSGLASVAPLLFGKDAWKQFMNKGLLQTAKEAIFGKAVAPSISDQQFEAVVRQYGNPYGENSGWGQDVLQPDTGVYATPPTWEWQGGDWGPADTGDWWQGGDWGVPDTSNWWDFSGGSGGDYVDLFGGV